MVKPWAFLIFLLANGGDGAWVSTPPRQNYGYSSYKNNYQSTSLNSITSQLKDLNWKVSKYKEQLYKAEDEIDSLWVSEVGQDYKIQSLEGKDKQHDGRLYSLEVNNARQDEEIDSLETKAAVNSGRISDNDDDILDLQVKQGELCELVGDVGEDGDYGENGLVGKVEVLEDKQAELCNDVEELQMNCCDEGDARLTALENNCCDEGDARLTNLEMNCCDEGDARLTTLENNCCDEGDARLTALENNCCDEGDARLTALEMNCCDEGDARLTTLETSVSELSDDVEELQAKQRDLCAFMDAYIKQIIPDQCFNHHLFTDGTRKYDVNTQTSGSGVLCDRLVTATDENTFEIDVTVETVDPFIATVDTKTRTRSMRALVQWQGDGWYKFEENAGSRMFDNTDPVPLNSRCGTYATGWMDDTHPNVLETKDVEYCFHWASNVCDLSKFGKVTNCGPFYVYYLVNAPGCYFGYCGTDLPLL